MKKIFLTTTTLFLILILFNCNKEELNTKADNVINSKSTNTHPQIDIGFYHNEALSHLHNNFDVEKFDDISSIIDEIAFYLNNHNNMDLHISNLELESFKNQFLPIYEAFPDETDLKVNMINFLLNSNEISQGLANELYDFSANNYDDIETSINLIIMNNSLTTKELNYLTTFKNVGKYSDYYWTNGNGNDGENPVFWDALGSIAGLYGGPIWSIVNGALASYIMSGPIAFNPPTSVQL